MSTEYGVFVEFPGAPSHTINFGEVGEEAAQVTARVINRDTTKAEASLVIREVGEWVEA